MSADRPLSNFVQVITSCQSAGGAGKKAVIQEALAAADTVTRSLIWYALNPYITFGVRKWDKPATYASTCPSVDAFLVLLKALGNRELSGNAAAAAVTYTLALYPAEVARLLELVIEKDLAAGFSDETFNKVWKGKNVSFASIPTFDVMLADKCDDPEEFLERLKFPAQADWKYDGNRCIAFVKEGQPVECRARSGKVSEHLNGLFDEDLLRLRDHLGYDFVLDGEAFASDFTETMNAKKSDNDGAKQALRLRAFFLMPLSDWMAQKTTITMRANREQLGAALEAVRAVKVILSEGREVRDYAEMVTYCNEVIDTHKQEGLIIKNWDAVYQWDRTIDWCKVKRMYDVDARVVAWYPGRKKSRLESTCGGITVEGRDEHGRPFRTNVGSGFTDEMRAHIAANFDDIYEGSTAVITYQEMSKAKGSDIHALRFPVVKQLLRDDKVVPALGD
jgi:ATP-dependent DNA ligase